MENMNICGDVNISLNFTKFKFEEFTNSVDFNINKEPGVPGYDRQKDTGIIDFDIKVIGLHLENKCLVITSSGEVEGGENIFMTLEVKAKIPTFVKDKTGTLYFNGSNENVEDTVKVYLTKSELSGLVRGVIRPYVIYNVHNTENTENKFSVKLIPNVMIM